MLNDNLEQQSKLLYDYWFTQFDFPDENGKPYRSSGGKMVWNELLKRDIPADFRVVPFLEVASWESNSQPAKNKFIYEQKEGYVRFIQNRDYNSNTYITYIPMTQTLSVVDRFDILMDKYGDAGAVRYGLEGAFNVALGKICVHNQNYKEYIRSFLSSDGIYNYLHNSCMASTRASLNESNLAMLNILIPDENIIFEYEKLLHKIRLSILQNNDETQILIDLRDWLLPMLMNGQATIIE
ncbi:MAG: restriction endonuclease subunit S [Clostridiales bacterium]|nr:restriction endonuclease subunit S [Clostridiales bacterium]